MIFTPVMCCSYQSNSIVDMGWSYRAICFLRFVKGQVGARNCSEPFIVILSAFHLAGKTKHSVLYETKNKRPPVQKRSLLNRVSSCSTGGGALARAASKACHHKRNRILSRWVGRQSKKLSTRIRSAVTAFNVHCSLEIAPAATDESGGDGVPGPPAPATADGAVDA